MSSSYTVAVCPGSSISVPSSSHASRKNEKAEHSQYPERKSRAPPPPHRHLAPTDMWPPQFFGPHVSVTGKHGNTGLKNVAAVSPGEVKPRARRVAGTRHHSPFPIQRGQAHVPLRPGSLSDAAAPRRSRGTRQEDAGPTASFPGIRSAQCQGSGQRSPARWRCCLRARPTSRRRVACRVFRCARRRSGYR